MFQCVSLLDGGKSKKVLTRIISLGDSKQTINTDDLPFIIAEVLESKNYQHIKLFNFHCTQTLNFEQEVLLLSLD